MSPSNDNNNSKLPNDANPSDSGNSLESTPETTLEVNPDANSLEGDDSSTTSSLASNDQGGQVSNAPFGGASGDNKPSLIHKLWRLVRKLDIYLLIFLLIVMVAIIAVFLAVDKNKPPKSNSQIQGLNQSAIDQLNNNDVQVGNSQQTLDIQSNAVFGGNVLVKNSLEVAGTLQLAGSLNLPGITVSGSTDLGQVNATTLSLSGAETVKGQLTVQQGLTVNGGGSFSGSISAPTINVSSLQVNGDIQIAHHLTTTGGLPHISTDGSIGGGGTASISGDDTAGTVSINTGSGAGAGCLVTISFTQSYSSAPNVVITPANSNGAGLGYYVNRTASSFSICGNSPADGTAYSFSYFVIN